MARRLSGLLALLLLLVTVVPALAQDASNSAVTVYLPLIGGAGATSDVLVADDADSGAVADLTDLAAEEVAAAGGAGAVFVMTNANDPVRGNEVVMYHRSADGTLTVVSRFPTGGQGLGGGLGSQGAVTLSDNGRWLFVVNAGSNELSVFAVRANALILTDKVASGGIQPTSVTVRKGLVYVLHAGDTGNIAGFVLRNDGKLSPLGNSIRPLSNQGAGTAPAPAQISFSPDGKQLLVTERASNLILTYDVKANGRTTGPMTNTSAGVTPFGFAFARNATLVVSEAFGGAVDGSAASSYQVQGNGALNLVSASIPTGQTAACWIVVTKDGKYAYTTNTGSASLSLYRVEANGSLTLLNSRAGETGVGTGPTDAGASRSGQLVYALSPRSQTIIGFRVQADGSLQSVGSFGGLPLNSAGIAVW